MVYPQVQYLGPAYGDLFRGASPSLMRELDGRSSAGIHVRLLWHRVDGHVLVAVDDTKTGHRFELPVGEGERAIDVFNHPFAYAARRHRRIGLPSPTFGDTALVT